MSPCESAGTIHFMESNVLIQYKGCQGKVKVLQIETDSAIGICIAGYVMYATSSSRAAIPSKLNQNVFQNNTNLLRCELDFLAKIKYNMHA